MCTIAKKFEYICDMKKENLNCWINKASIFDINEISFLYIDDYLLQLNRKVAFNP